jgi:hypothetical protein
MNACGRTPHAFIRGCSWQLPFGSAHEVLARGAVAGRSSGGEVSPPGECYGERNLN